MDRDSHFEPETEAGKTKTGTEITRMFSSTRKRRNMAFTRKLQKRKPHHRRKK